MATPRALRLAALALLGWGASACQSAIARFEAGSTGDELAAIVGERGLSWKPRACASVERSRVVACEATLTKADVDALRGALQMGAVGAVKSPGPAPAGCMANKPEGALALITPFPWIARSHYRYLLVVVAPGGGVACIETEHGYG